MASRVRYIITRKSHARVFLSCFLIFFSLPSARSLSVFFVPVLSGHWVSCPRVGHITSSRHPLTPMTSPPWRHLHAIGSDFPEVVEMKVPGFLSVCIVLKFSRPSSAHKCCVREKCFLGTRHTCKHSLDHIFRIDTHCTSTRAQSTWSWFMS